jgi:hypothetical protein
LIVCAHFPSYACAARRAKYRFDATKQMLLYLLI